MMKGKKWILWLGLLLAGLAVISVTYALFIASSQPLQNTFTVGKVQLTLTETTGDRYSLLPGAELPKDPVLCVEAGSEDCWLFVRIEKNSNFDAYATYAMTEGWTALSGRVGVYYRKVTKNESDQRFPILLQDRITIRDTVTEEQLKALSSQPTLTFYGYAVQQEGLPDAGAAWLAILEETEE